MRAISMFSSAGIASLYLKDIGIDVVLANELIPRRAELYKHLYPKSHMINGDITDAKVFQDLSQMIDKTSPNILISTPPCQGMSSLGKKDYDRDERNYLINYTIKIIEEKDFDYIIIENVPKFLKLYFPHNNKLYLIDELLIEKFSDKYHIDSRVLNAKDFGVAQSRPRAFIRMWKKTKQWKLPPSESEINLRDAIGHLPSLEANEKSNIPWHFAKYHNEREVLALRHTPTGKSAMSNEVYYPRKENGERIKGFHNTYKRMRWDKPAPARAINNGNMGGHNNVHPGKKLKDGTYSDARALTLLELFIVSSLPTDWNLPDWASDTLIRTVIGESIPPLFFRKIMEGIVDENK